MARKNRFYEEPQQEDVLEIPVADDVVSEIVEEVSPEVVEEIAPEVVEEVNTTEPEIIFGVVEDPKPLRKEKVCDVLGYNSISQRVYFDFNGFGFNIGGVSENPGKTIVIKYEGKVGKPGFKFSL